MRPLILSPQIEAAIRRVVRYADTHRVGAQGVARMHARAEPLFGARPEHVLMVPDGYHCVFSVEQVPDFGWCRHLSVSVQGAQYPQVPPVVTLLPLFGFTPTLAATLTAAEEGRIVPHRFIMFVENDTSPSLAVNLIEPMEQAS